MDPAYYRELRKEQKNCLNGLRLKHMLFACRASCIVTDHGLHSLIILAKLSKIKLVDVWHGIPFKGFDSIDFRTMRDYTSVFVSSPSMREIYINRYGFDGKQIKVTGYGRTDRLYNRQYKKNELMHKYSELPTNQRLVLFAPTWKHGDSERRELPFGMDTQGLLTQLTPLLDRMNCSLVVRAHLNTRSEWGMPTARIKFLPMDEYPQTEELLFLADALICDWSSIAFDYLALRRPTFFLDCKEPFRKGFTYGPEYRFGPVVRNLEELRETLIRYLHDPARFSNDFGEKIDSVTQEVYGDYLDGSATRRYVKEILHLVSQAESSNSHGSG